MNTNLIANDTDKIFSELYANPDKPTLILLHGGPDTFTKGNKKIKPCKSKNYTMEPYLSDIEAVRPIYKIDRFHFMGTPLGVDSMHSLCRKISGQFVKVVLMQSGIQGTNETRQIMTEKKSCCSTNPKPPDWKWTQGWEQIVCLECWEAKKAYNVFFKQVMINYNGKNLCQKDSLNVNADLDLLKAAPINKTRKEIVKYPLLNGINKS
ncbi:hypothetical protein FQR65_LT18024 [Abscondita terminalis]|nr:hypothetical protein FQR65_LT18024 [Abscondita terminalis]